MSDRLTKESTTADELVRQRQVSDVAPDQRTTAPGPARHPLIDQGPRCESAPGDGCILTPTQRTRLLMVYMNRVATAEARYLDAILELRIEKLIAKDDDLSWVALLVLDLIGAHVLATIGSALKQARKAGSAQLTEIQVHAGMNGTFDSSSWASRAEDALLHLSDKRIELGLKPGLDAAKKGVAARLKGAQNAASKSKTASSVGYLESLRNEASLGFQTVRERAPVDANDVALLVMLDGFDARFHSVGIYKQALSAKLERFHASGVTKLGRGPAIRKEPVDGAPHLSWKSEVMRDTRLVWLVYRSGKPLQLAYQRHDGHPGSPSYIHPGDPGFPGDANLRYGPRQPITKQPEVDRVVPSEFVDVAIARNRSIWGVDPEFVTVDDRAPSRPAPAAPQTAAPNPSAPRPPVPIPDALVLKRDQGE